MSKKSKGVVFDLKTPYGIGMYEDAKTRLKYQTLMQDYKELQKEADVMRSKLDSSKQKKLMLAAEVRFLRRRYKYLVTTKNTNSSQELSPVKASLKKRGKITKEKLLIGKEGSQHRLPLIPEPNSKKKQNPLRESFPVSDQPRKKKSYKGHGLSLISSQVSDLNHKGRTNVMKEVAVPNMIPILDRNQKERISGSNDATLCHPTVAFDLNQVTATFIEKETLPTRAPVFDLNEISTEDEEFHGNFEANKVEEGGKSLIRGINEEQPSDMKLSICRNAGESSSRGGKRKISWQDPVALRV